MMSADNFYLVGIQFSKPQDIKKHEINTSHCSISGSLWGIPHIFPLILLRYFRKTFKDVNLDLLLYDCLSAVSSPAKFGYYIQRFSGTAINLNLFERDDVYRCEYGEMELLLDLLLSANTLTASPFPGIY